MTSGTPHLTEEQIKEIAERRAASLKRIQEMHHKAEKGFTDRGAKHPKQTPPKGRTFRHQGR